VGGRYPHGTRHAALGAPFTAALPGIAVSIALAIQIVPSAQQPATLTVTTRSRATAPGEVIRLDIHSAVDLDRVGVSVPWHPVVAFRTDPRDWRALVGVDLDIAPGDYEAKIDGAMANGDHAFTAQAIHVEAKEFPTRNLRVAPQFVTPPPGAAARIDRERQLLGRLFRVNAPAPRWTEPFAVPIAGAVVSGFGVRSVFNNEPRAPHGGADFASAEGTPIAAPAGGDVVLAQDLYFTGNTVVVDHGVGLQSLFAHLSRIDVHEGEAVARGKVIGAVGATGRATGPHLHWTVRLNGARVDPLSLIYALEE
jgi:murein DD-endopeptidase MepM/ murein hydrolase activator NlpD